MPLVIYMRDGIIQNFLLSYYVVEDAQDHIHFDNSRWTLNRDGTWGHNSNGQPPKLTKKILKWLQDIGWKLL